MEKSRKGRNLRSVALFFAVLIIYPTFDFGVFLREISHK